MATVFVYDQQANGRSTLAVSRQAMKVLDIIQTSGSVTRLTAMHYGIANITARIAELRTAGIQVLCEENRDMNGARYGKWSLPYGVAVAEVI
jgi:hypothetical protein